MSWDEIVTEPLLSPFLSIVRAKIPFAAVVALVQLTGGLAWGQARPIPFAPPPPAAAPAELPTPPAYPGGAAAPPGPPAPAQGTPESAPLPPAAVAAPTTPPLRAAPAYRLSGPMVYLQSDNPRARLQRLTLRWNDVCTTPCGGPVETAGPFRVAGGGMRPSPTFQFPRQSGSVHINVAAGSAARYWVGAGVALGGLGALLAGGMMLALADSSRASTDPYSSSNATRDTQHAMGIAYLVGGVICLLIGVPLWLGNNTAVEVR